MSKFAAVPLDLVRKVLLPKIATPLTLLHILLGGLIALVFAAGADPAMAQGYIGDARRVGMGGAGDWGNTAWDLVGEESGYRSIPIPIGLFQVLSDFDVFDPDSEEFNPALIMSYASSPMHYSFNRGGSDVGRQFLLDIVNAEISRDLSTYSGFVPRSSLTGGGVASPDWGKTFWISGDGVGSDHGFRVAAGPYISMDAGLSLDPDLVAAFNGPDPDASYAIDSQTAAQGAAALTLGYRGDSSFLMRSVIETASISQ